MIYRHRLFSNPTWNSIIFYYDMFQASPWWNIVDFSGSKFNLLRQMNWAISWSIPCDVRSHQVGGFGGLVGLDGWEIPGTKYGKQRIDVRVIVVYVYYLTFWVIFDSGQVLGQNVWMDLWIEHPTHCGKCIWKDTNEFVPSWLTEFDQPGQHRWPTQTMMLPYDACCV